MGLFLLFAHGCEKQDPAELDLGMWYWHTPFAVSPEEENVLADMGVGTLYVRGGTFGTEGDGAALKLPQRYERPPKGVRIVLVYNFDPDLLRQFEKISLERLRADISAAVLESRTLSQNAGIAVAGVQLDVDVPTRLLPRYADLLRSLRPQIGEGEFSITALPTWLDSKSFRQVCDAVDYVVPQFYEGRTGRTVDDLQPVGDPEALRRGLEKLARLGRPFRVGLPAYGHALLYDDEGKLSSMYHGLSLGDALRHPGLKFERSEFLPGGEDLLVLKAIAPGQDGRGLGFRIAYFAPTPAMVSEQVEIVRRRRPNNCLGIVFYRFAGPDQSLCLPLSSIAAALEGEEARVEMNLEIEERSLPWSLIAGEPAAVPARQLSVALTHQGNAPTFPSPEGIRVLLLFDRPGIVSARPGDYDAIDFGSFEGGLFRPCGKARATAVLLRRFHMIPGQQLAPAAIELEPDGPNLLRASWHAKAVGKEFEGEAKR
jgi:hypothetical protein